jgi:hypothetical protein
MGDIRELKPKRPGCSCSADGSVTGCYHHDPKRQADRRRNATKGGKGKAARRVAALWDEVQDVIRGVESGRLEPPQANSMLRGFNTLIALDRLDVERSELEIQQRRLELDEEERLELIKEIEELRDLAAMNKERNGYYGH